MGRQKTSSSGIEDKKTGRRETRRQEEEAIARRKALQSQERGSVKGAITLAKWTYMPNTHCPLPTLAPQ
jgi:hypothetical protein